MDMCAIGWHAAVDATCMIYATGGNNSLYVQQQSSNVQTWCIFRTTGSCSGRPTQHRSDICGMDTMVLNLGRQGCQLAHIHSKRISTQSRFCHASPLLSSQNSKFRTVVTTNKLGVQINSQSMQQGGLLQRCKCLGPTVAYCIVPKIEGQGVQQGGLLQCCKCLGPNGSY